MGLILTSVGCSGSVESFVRGALPDRTEPLPSTTLGSEKVGVKVSGGAVAAAGSTVGAAMSISNSQNAMVGATIGARIGISQNSQTK